MEFNFILKVMQAEGDCISASKVSILLLVLLVSSLSASK